MEKILERRIESRYLAFTRLLVERANKARSPKQAIQKFPEDSTCVIQCAVMNSFETQLLLNASRAYLLGLNLEDAVNEARTSRVRWEMDSSEEYEMTGSLIGVVDTSEDEDSSFGLTIETSDELCLRFLENYLGRVKLLVWVKLGYPDFFDHVPGRDTCPTQNTNPKLACRVFSVKWSFGFCEP